MAMFWHFQDCFKERTAFTFEGNDYSFTQLQTLVSDAKAKLPSAGALVFLFCKNDINTLVHYLACLQNQVAVMLLDAGLSEQMSNELVVRFQPQAIVRSGEIQQTDLTQTLVDSRLAVLLPTSGSTGAAKQVALSYENLQANAESICSYLPIQDSDTTITTLPCHYSYGLSVLNTHLLKGARCLLTDASVVSKDFWLYLQNDKITSFAGVPYTYEMLYKLRFHQKQFPSLRYITQAGGRLKPEVLSVYSQWMQEQEKAFYVMYGQTEATARMAWLPPEKLSRKPSSIGNAIPGGQLSLVKGSKALDGDNGELIYQGPNVMLGYADSREGLAVFSPTNVLKTGDVAWQDDEGDFHIVGRLKRFVKIFGLRLGLDEIERFLDASGVDARVCGIDDKLCVAVKNAQSCSSVKQQLSERLKLHPSVIEIIQLEHFPVNSNQKTDYQAIESFFEAERR
ncbi:AMP-binding protein [Planctobacterium marinum]|uniref:AMP-dependent synthetase n=1 Tax=Planctobacterium marinum TaxID=1631968 RepID=A0AA48KT33_9ALTE|nr:AMP-dependent synthetase [Planctobacterium marinum]